MTYILLIKTKDVSCATDQYVLTQEEVKQLSSVDTLIKELKKMRDNERNKINIAEVRGFDEGYQEGYLESRNEMKTLFTEHLEATFKRIMEVHTLSQQSIIDLAFNITRKIASEIGPEAMITGIINRAVKNLKLDKTLEITVNSEIAQDIDQKLRNYLSVNNNDTYPVIEVIPDPDIGILDCIIRSDSGETEASFEQQLNALENKLSRVERDSRLNT
jgi:flagellar biosynthesis/type III secretory pathway protein FliH